MGVLNSINRFKSERESHVAALDDRARQLLVPYLDEANRLGYMNTLREVPIFD